MEQPDEASQIFAGIEVLRVTRLPDSLSPVISEIRVGPVLHEQVGQTRIPSTNRQSQRDAPQVPICCQVDVGSSLQDQSLHASEDVRRFVPVRDHHMQGRVSLARPFLNDSVDVATAAPEDSDEIFDLHGIQPTTREALVTEVLGHEMQHRPAGGVAPDCPLLGHDDGMRHAANLLQEVYLRLENRRRILRLLLCSGRSDQTRALIQHI